MVVEREANFRQQWRNMKLLEKLQVKRKGGEKYFLLDGPPYANYVPHIGHIRNTVYKDLYVRWNFMKGKDVLFQPGFDTHGLPIENMVEKKLGLQSKKDIEKLGIRKFMQTCRDSAALNKDLWMEAYDLLGSWYAWKTPYLTYENSYIESVWWSFKRFWDKGLAYEGKKPVFWCPSCETALAGYEATDSYKIVKDPAIYVKFKLIDEDASLLVYTTTPWTLPANCAVFVAPEEAYVKVKTKDHGDLILAKERLVLLDDLEIGYEVIDTFQGKDLDGRKYESLLDVQCQQELQDNENALRVFLSRPILKERVGSKVAAKKGLTSGDVYEDFVTVDEGTGLVHCAPGHGKSDNEIGKVYGIPAVSPLDDQCKFTDAVGKFAGRFVKEADHDIAEELHQHGRLLHYGSLEHSYPLCWRCKSPLIFRLSDQWFLNVEKVKDIMLDENERVTWQPGFAKERFSNWVANADDWNFSRQRYWGVPIPIWKSASGKVLVIGSKEELKQLATSDIPSDFDLHAVNEVTLKKDGEEYARINDIFDVWFDSGSAPYAALGYPFQNKELFEEHFPVDRINESQDQIRGWFYSLMFCSVGVFGKAPFKTISMPGWVLDEKGEKMSKSVGNVVFAKEALEEYGADAIRFYYCFDNDPANTQKFSLATVGNDVRRFLTIWTNLVKLVKNAGKSFGAKAAPRAIEDEWLLSRLHSTIKEVRGHVEQFTLHLAGRSLHQFLVEDVSRTYVQLVRERLDDDDVPMQLVGLALWETAKLAAAITPFQSEFVYQELGSLYTGEKEESVHLELLPVPETKLMHKELEEQVLLAGEVIAGILAARDKASVGVRWPVQEAIIDADAATVNAARFAQELIKRQTNVKTLTYSAFAVDYVIKPNFKAMGKVFGEQTGDAIVAYKSNAAAVDAAIKQGKEITVQAFTYTPDFFSKEKIVPQTHAVGELKNGSTYIVKALTPELENEGFAREATRRLQQLRKDAGLEKQDRITAALVTALADRLTGFQEEIAKKVGADSLRIAAALDASFAHTASAKIKGEQFDFFLSKA